MTRPSVRVPARRGETRLRNLQGTPCHSNQRRDPAHTAPSRALCAYVYIWVKDFIGETRSFSNKYFQGKNIHGLRFICNTTANLPAERKPITGDAFRYLNRGTIPIVEQRNINKSFPRGFKDPSSPPLSIGLSKSGVTATGFAATCCADNLGK